MKHLVTVLLLQLFVATASSPMLLHGNSSVPWNTQNSQAPPMILRVINEFCTKAGTVNRDKGSAVLIENQGMQWIVTAAHIFRYEKGRIIVVTINGTSYPAKIVAMDRKWDIAILKVAQKIDLPSMAFAKTLPTMLEPTRAWGFGRDDQIQGQLGKVAGYVVTEKGESAQTLKTTGQARDGDSGGPVVNQNGELVSLIWGTDGRHTYSTTITKIQSLLNKINVTETQKQIHILPSLPDESKENPNEETASNTPIQHDLENLPEKATLRKGLPQLLFVTLQNTVKWHILAQITGASSVVGIAWLFHLRFKKKRKSKEEQKKYCENISDHNECKSETKKMTLDDHYAMQLNSVYALSGHSVTADATLGRLYEQKLLEAEESSNAELMTFAKKLREQVANQFLRIHSSNPAPIES